jgi:hypothetical protein
VIAHRQSVFTLRTLLEVAGFVETAFRFRYPLSDISNGENL